MLDPFFLHTSFQNKESVPQHPAQMTNEWGLFVLFCFVLCHQEITNFTLLIILFLIFWVLARRHNCFLGCVSWEPVSIMNPRLIHSHFYRCIIGSKEGQSSLATCQSNSAGQQQDPGEIPSPCFFPWKITKTAKLFRLLNIVLPDTE